MFAFVSLKWLIRLDSIRYTYFYMQQRRHRCQNWDWSSLFKLFIWLHKQTIPHYNPVYMTTQRELLIFFFHPPLTDDKLAANPYQI